MMNKDATIGIKTLSGGATAPEGIVAGGVVCGVRNSGRRDLGLLFSERECTAVAVFARNVVRGAPLEVTREAVESGSVRAVVVNSGYANAATGQKGLEDAYAMQTLASEVLGIEAREVAVASTGVIGERLPMDKITAGVEGGGGELGGGGGGFSEALLTPDTPPQKGAGWGG